MNKMVKRVIMSVAGVLIGGVCVGFYKLAAFGVDPFQSLMSGLDRSIPISFGTLYVIVNAVLLLFSILCNRKCIGIATFINLFLLGYVTEFTYNTLQNIFPEPSMVIRIICLVGGSVVICIGSALYMTAALGVSTYDAVAITMADKWKLGKFKYIRICTDLVCVIAGVALFMIAGGTFDEIGAVVGVGTIITAFCMGPLIEFFNKTIARPILK